MANTQSYPYPRLRMEVFPHDRPVSLDFYMRVLRFTEPTPPPADADLSTAYRWVKRGSIALGISPSPVENYHPLGKDFKQRYELRLRPLGAELVLVLPNVDELRAERDYIIGQGWPLDDELKLQDWGSWDFRVRDPDGYYWRITADGQGQDH